MLKMFIRGGVILALLAGPALIAGCSGTKEGKTGDKVQINDKDDKKEQGAKDKKDDTSEDGWWCNEHGIPEDECSMCSAKVEKECKAKGDWCEKHNRAKSQCFICDPKLKEKYAARYRSKYGKEPAPIKE